LHRTRNVFSLIIKIQALCRGALARMAVSAMSGRSETPPSTSRSGKSAFVSEKSAHMRTSYERAKARKKAAPQARALYPPTLEVAKICSIIIQTYWRSYVGRICFLQSLADVVVVQSAARRWLTYRRLATGRLPARGSDRRNSRKQHMKPQYSETEVVRSFAQFAKHPAAEGSQTFVPLRNFSDEDAEQAPIPAQPYLQPYRDVERDVHKIQQQHSHGHFDDPSRFGGSRNVWNRSGAANEVVLSQSNSYRHGKPRVESSSQELTMATSRQYYGSQGSSRAVVSNGNHRTISSEQYARSKGWNAQEEIDKELTRNLMSQWKQKDMVNSWKIEKSKPGR
jgi:IQ calmodulin-binding motif